MKMFDKELINSKYVSINEKGWHISDDAPEELKEKFRKFIKESEEGAEVELK